MIQGTYRVSFNVDFDECGSKEEATQAVMAMLSEMMDDEEFPEVDFELVEEFDIEYGTEEEIEELEF